MSMDIAREGVRERRRKRRLLLGLGGGAGLAAVIGLALWLEPAAPAVDRSTVVVDTVRRGELAVGARGPGTLVPVVVRRVAAAVDGRVAAVHVLPGAEVDPGTVILTLENPALEQQLEAAGLDLAAAEANLVDRRVRLRREALHGRSRLASVEAEARQAALNAEADAAIHAEGIIGRLALEDSRSLAEELAGKAAAEAERLRLAEAAARAELEGEEARVNSLRAKAALQRELAARLEVRAGIAGTLQEVGAEAGEQVTAGDDLARVAALDRLKAELRVPEAQARDIEIGQTARVDTRNGIVAGSVSRVEPSVREGAVTVDIALDSPLPRGARPDLSVEGLIEIARLPDVLHVGRPAVGREREWIELFRVGPDGRSAGRVAVRLGRVSVSAVEILEGLAEGDEVVLSDPGPWAGAERIRLR